MKNIRNRKTHTLPIHSVQFTLELGGGQYHRNLHL
jgi:hypothetical protein